MKNAVLEILWKMWENIYRNYIVSEEIFILQNFLQKIY